MSARKYTFKHRCIHWIARQLPNLFLYWCAIHVWAKAKAETYTDKTPDEITIGMALDNLGVTDAD
jgi:hypothetical protein